MIPPFIQISVTKDMLNDDCCPVTTAIAKAYNLNRDQIYISDSEIYILRSDSSVECVYELPVIVKEFISDYQNKNLNNTVSLDFMARLIDAKEYVS